jgi:hypothetical protein
MVSTHDAPLRVMPTGSGAYPNPSAEEFIQKYCAIHDRAKEELEHTQAKYKKNHDVRYKEAPTFKPEDLV